MNENLFRLAKQCSDVWQQLGAAQRLQVIFATGAALATLIAVAVWSSRTDYALLFGRLDPAEASKVASALEQQKAPYKISQSGTSIFVPQDRVHALRMQLASQGIPQSDGVGFEIFDKPNFGISDFVQRANYLRALQGELSRTVSQLDEVESARVMVVLPDNRLLTGDSRKPTASVFVRVRRPGGLPPASVNAVRFLIANAVEGLLPNNVSVIDNRGTVLSENFEDGSVGGSSQAQLAARKDLEHYLARKAQDMLEAVLGPGQAVVRVAADINWDSMTRTEEKFDPDSQVARTETITDENVDALVIRDATFSPQGNSQQATNNAASAPGNNSRTKKKTTSNEYEITRTTSNLMQAPGSLRRLSAAVFINAQSDPASPTPAPVPRSTQELDKLKRIVQSALGIGTDADPLRTSEITLEEISFNEFNQRDLFDLDPKRQLWWEMARNGIYPIAALLVLGLLWRAFNRSPSADIPIGIPLGSIESLNGNGHDRKNGNGHTPWPKEPVSGAVTADVLNQLMREHPENMTQAVRNWLNQRGASK